MFIIGIILISIGSSTRLPVFENKMQERMGNATAYETDNVMIATGIGVTVVGLGLSVVGGLYTWRKRG